MTPIGKINGNSDLTKIFGQLNIKKWNGIDIVPSWTDPTTYTTITPISLGDVPGLETPVYCAANSSIWFKIVYNISSSTYPLICAVDSNYSDYGDGTAYLYSDSGTLVDTQTINWHSVRMSNISISSGSHAWIKFTAGSSAQRVACMATYGSSFVGNIYVSPLDSSSYLNSSLSNNIKYYTCGIGKTGFSGKFYYNFASNNSAYGHISCGRNTSGGTNWQTNNEAYPTGENLNNTSYVKAPDNDNVIAWVYLDNTQGDSSTGFYLTS